jgi:uncharacterized membrane protein
VSRWLPVIVLLVAACAADEVDPCPNDLTYDNFGRGLVEQYCTGCHSTNIPSSQRNDAPEVVNLDSYVGILEWVLEIQEEATPETPTMPPGGGTTQLERDLLAEWIECTVIDEARRYGQEREQ